VWAAVEAMVAERGEGAGSSLGGSGVELGVCVSGEKGRGDKPAVRRGGREPWAGLEGPGCQ
jgi:hypothetical protein